MKEIIAICSSHVTASLLEE